MALDTVEKLSKKLDLQPKLHIELEDVPKTLIKKVKEIPGVRDAQFKGTTLDVQCDSKVKAQIITVIEDNGGTITNFTTLEPSLEEVFLRYTEG